MRHFLDWQGGYEHGKETFWEVQRIKFAGFAIFGSARFDNCAES